MLIIVLLDSHYELLVLVQIMRQESVWAYVRLPINLLITGYHVINNLQIRSIVLYEIRVGDLLRSKLLREGFVKVDVVRYT